MVYFKINYLFKDSLLKNSIYLMMSSYITSIIGFFFWIIAARYYSPNDIGVTSAIFSSISLISMIGSLGLYRALIFYLPRYKNTNEIINSCLMVNIISSISFSIIFILGLKIWSPDLSLVLNKLNNILIFIFISTAVSTSSLIGAVFTAGRRSSFQMIKEMIYHFVKIFPLFLFANLGSIGILMSISIGILLSIIMGYFILFKIWKYIPNLTLDPVIKRMASFSAGNYIADTFYNLPRLVLPIIILNKLSPTYAGYFYIAIMMANLLYGISLSIAASFLVESSEKDKFWLNVNKAIKFNIVILIPCIILFILFGKFILEIFNKNYAEGATITMIILTLASIPVSLVTIFNSVRNAQNRVASMIKMNIMVALITLILSIPLINIMNIEGVAISYLIANTCGAIFVINRIQNPKEFTLRLLNEIKKNLSYNFYRGDDKEKI